MTALHVHVCQPALRAPNFPAQYHFWGNTMTYERFSAKKKAMEEYIEEALTARYIRLSTSPAGFFFVEKKDGGLRQCIDYLTPILFT